MAITFVSSAVNSNDVTSASWSGATNTAIAVPQPTGMQANDLLLVVCAYRDANVNGNPAFANTGAEDWKTEFTQFSGATNQLYKYHGSWCHYSGSWGSPTIFIRDNQLQTACTSTASIIVASFAFRTDVSGCKIYPETIAMINTYAAPTGPPYNVSTTGADFAGGHETRKSPESNTLGIYLFSSVDDNDWTFQTAGWTSAFSGTDQIRRSFNLSLTAHYQIKSDGTAFANVINQQDSTTGPDAGSYSLHTWSERNVSDFTHIPGSTSRYFVGQWGALDPAGHDDRFSLSTATRSEFPDWAPTDNATFSFWVYFRSLCPNGDPRLWVRHRTDRPITGTRYEGGSNDVDYSWMIGMDPPNATSATHRLRIRMNNSAVTSVANNVNGQFTTNTWYNVIVTFSRDLGSIGAYVNGSVVSFDVSSGFSTTAWNTANTHKVVIGNQAPYKTPNFIRDVGFDGYLAHPAAWNRIINQNEIAALADGVDPRAIGDSLIFYVPQMGAEANSDLDIIGNRASTVTNAYGREFAPPKFRRKTAASYGVVTRG